MKLKLCYIVFSLMLFTNVTKAQFVKKHGQLSVQGTQLVDKNNNPIVLRGLSFGWHSLWPRFYNEKAVSWLKKDFNCNIVRAAMGVELGDLSYINNPQFAKEKVEAVVNGAIKSDIYVIIDWHSHNVNLKEAKQFFAEMSKKYAKYP
ncbi:MAG TPA: cellulase family glycosylhydrolase, partial [Flavobacterium sp.]|nr:cellulase family glycosylhydrolase [Flavobacterium sp.]